MDIKKLCLDLVYCNTENEIVKILNKYGFWNSHKDWHSYGDTENNFATIGNQQTKPEAALVEKLINSVDAMLTSKCLERKINPEGRDAPKSMKNALIKFFNIYDGKLTNLSSAERGRLAENICLVATGTKANPSYTIIDKGEGQSAKEMPNTILSIGKSNKLRIPFVQGKFNMGGTGVFRFCGKSNMQLVISKRNPNITIYENDETGNKWSFTIIRRIDPGERFRNSVYKYLAPNGEILSFEGKKLPLLPSDYPNPFGNNLEWGTFIKLYEYQMIGLKTNILFDLYNKLSLLMPTIALPVRLYERRKGYTGHTYETTLSGLTIRLDEDRRENLEEGFPTSLSFSAMGEKMKASIYVFKLNQSKKYTKNEGIVFVINGQTHGYLTKSFFSRQSVGMGYLTESILVMIDCSSFTKRSKEDLFMNSRDRLCSVELRAEIEKNIEYILRTHPGLKELRERRRREALEGKLKDSKPLADVIEKIIKKSPTLSKLFIDGIRLPNPFKLKKVKGGDKYRGKEFPTYFKLIEKCSKLEPKLCPINWRFRVQYQTDAENEYFNRDKEPGNFILEESNEEIQNYTLNLWNGRATLTVELPGNSKINDLLFFKSSIIDISKTEALEDEFYVRIKKEEGKSRGVIGKRKPPQTKDEGEEVEKSTYLALPNVREVRKEEWMEPYLCFNKESSLKVIDNGEKGYDFFINMDNIHLLTELKIFSSEKDEKLLNSRYKYGMVLIGIALLNESRSKKEENLDSEDNEDIFSKIIYVTKVISPVLLPMISSLGGDLEIEKNLVSYEEE